MKRIVYTIVCLFALASCSKLGLTEDSEESSNGHGLPVTATAKNFEPVNFGGADGADTKVTITQTATSAPSFSWQQGDELGIIPMNNKTVQSNYEVTEIDSDSKTAFFDGGVWALKEGKEYAAYFPYRKEAVVSDESLSFSFSGQSQTSNNSLEHLGAYDYMYAAAVVPKDRSAHFDFVHKISLVRLQLTVPNADTFTKVILESSADWFADSASLKLSDGTMTATKSVKSTTINLNDIEPSEGNALTVWLALLPTSALNSKTVSVELLGKEGTYIGEFTVSTAFTAGSAYSYDSTLELEELEVEYVDLGLSVKWATCNIGAGSPEEYGDYYAWGETETKYDYSQGTYAFYKSETVSEGDIDIENKGYTRYIPQSCAENYGFCGFYDDKVVLDPDDDVAHVKLRGKWRMPTTDEFKELIDNCQCEWETIEGVKGLKFTSKKDGYTDKSIFLPAAGYRYGDDLKTAGANGSYWSSSLSAERPSDAYRLYFYSGSFYRDISNRYHGRSVRPVSE